jgi:hypothetical protein
MTKGTNKTIYKFKVSHNKSGNKKYYFTGNDLCNELGFPRASIYYCIKYKNGIIGDYHFERIYIPKKLLHCNGSF